MNIYAQALRKAAVEIRAQNICGWGNACAWGADEIDRLEKLLKKGAPKRPAKRPRSEYHEDFGPVLWWHLPIAEPPFVGQPSDDRWPEEDGYYTHWSPIPLPAFNGTVGR